MNSEVTARSPVDVIVMEQHLIGQDTFGVLRIYDVSDARAPV